MDDLKTKLEKAQQLYRAGRFQDPVFIQLARANHEPLKALLGQMLDDERDQARYMAADYLHEMELQPDDEILDKVRALVVNDSDALTRASAALVLGSHSRWPDAALEQALSKEKEPQAKQAIFLAILELMTSWDFADGQRSAVDQGTVELSMESATKLAESYRKGGD